MLPEFPAEVLVRLGEMGVTGGLVDIADLDNASQEGPYLVKLRASAVARHVLCHRAVTSTLPE